MNLSDIDGLMLDKVDMILAQWQRQHDDLPLQAMGILGRLKRCVSLLDNMLLTQFDAFDLNYGEFDVLAALRRSGEPYTLTPTQLYSTLMISSGTITNRLKHLQNKELIKRLPNPDDNRSLLVQLTDEGKILVDKVFFVHITGEKDLLADMPDEVLQGLDKGLRELLSQLERQI
ncbi:MarR family winged helix-turn-helix transcriptional regulator [Moraxella nasicaprae]|uniref:MarR family transcriptional regulator n=1 Tax=Moraxella nasicaprae TaxID=2904122 RepID=A0ABY6F5L2_9GAMM|nr:MarR family transcriptional regulator [Moraxella nasicaprae]UXZ05368.1 MarR family transcriptional regulator [Moraxella nasicaprae]